MTPLLASTLERLSAHRSTRTIPSRLADSAYDRLFGERICQLTREMCEERGRPYGSAVDDFIAGCGEFLRLQRALEGTGRYACSSFAEARRTVYDDPQVMSTTYLNSLLLSQALWINHFRCFEFFRTRFCDLSPPAAGSVLEVPVGTGFYLSEFARRRPAWRAVGVDLSAAAVDFARSLTRLNGAPQAEIRRLDVFDLERAAFDRVICGELLEHLERPEALLARLKDLLAPDGVLFLTTAIWSASPDHIYLFESAAEVREMLGRWFDVVEERVVPLEPDGSPEANRIPINYACLLRHSRAARPESSGARSS